MAFYTLYWSQEAGIAEMREFENDAAAWEFADELMTNRDKELEAAYEAAKEHGSIREIKDASDAYEYAPVISKIVKETENGERVELER